MVILISYGSMVILVWSDTLSWSSVVEAGLDLWWLYYMTSDLCLDNQPSLWLVCLHSSILVYNKSDLDHCLFSRIGIWCAAERDCWFLWLQPSFQTQQLNFPDKIFSAFVGNSVFLQISIWTNYNFDLKPVYLITVCPSWARLTPTLRRLDNLPHFFNFYLVQLVYEKFDLVLLGSQNWELCRLAGLRDSN